MISVIVPVYNCENYISSCLDSILSQTFCDFECICIDDGSVDGSSLILERYTRKDSRIVVHTITNHGQAYARNYGISYAKGDYICFVDADDVVDQNYLKRLLESALQFNSDVTMCGMRRVFKKKPNWLELNFEYYPMIHFEEVVKVSDKPELMLATINAPYCKLIKKEFIESNNIKFLEGCIYEDFYFTQSLLLHNPNISIVNEQLYCYFVYDVSTMTNKKSKTEDMYKIMNSLLNLYYERKLFDCYRSELEYLVIHHIAIGTVYRSSRQKWSSFFAERKRATQFMKMHNFTVGNKYCKKMPWFVRLYLKIVF